MPITGYLIQLPLRNTIPFHAMTTLYTNHTSPNPYAMHTKATPGIRSCSYTASPCCTWVDRRRTAPHPSRPVPISPRRGSMTYS